MPVKKWNRDISFIMGGSFFHKQYEYAIFILKKFLEEPDGWIENKLNSCLVLSCCYRQWERMQLLLIYFLQLYDGCSESGNLL